MKFIAVVFALLVLGRIAPAAPFFQEEGFGPSKGQSLLSLSGAYSSTSFTDDTLSHQERFQVGAAVGYFLTDEHEIGLGASIDLIHDTDTRSPELFEIVPYYNYNWRSSPRTWFYGGIHLGYLFGDLDAVSPDSAFEIGAQVGIRQWLTPSTSIFFEPRYTHFSSFFGSERNQFQTLFGLSVSL